MYAGNSLKREKSMEQENMIIICKLWRLHVIKHINKYEAQVMHVTFSKK